MSHVYKSGYSLIPGGGRRCITCKHQEILHFGVECGALGYDQGGEQDFWMSQVPRCSCPRFALRRLTRVERKAMAAAAKTKGVVGTGNEVMDEYSEFRRELHRRLDLD